MLYVATPIYIFTYFLIPTRHLSVSQIYRSSDGKTLAANPLLAACFLLSTGLLYLVYFSNNAFAERHTQAIGWFSIFFSCLRLLNYCWSLYDYRGTFSQMATVAPNSLYMHRTDTGRDFYR